jgi:hypothetical protein
MLGNQLSQLLATALAGRQVRLDLHHLGVREPAIKECLDLITQLRTRGVPHIDL